MKCAVCNDESGPDVYELGAVKGHLCPECGEGLHVAVSKWLADRMAVLAVEQKQIAREAARELRAREKAEDDWRRAEVKRANEHARRMRALRHEAYPVGFLLRGERAIEAGLEAAMEAEAAE